MWNQIYSAIFRCWVPLKKCQIVFHLEMIFSLHWWSEMGPQVERSFVRSESPVNVVKSTAQPSEIINILYDVRLSIYLISNLKLLKIWGNNSQWTPKIVSVGNGSMLRKHKPERSARFPQGTRIQLTARRVLMVVKTTTFYANHWD